MELLSKEYVSLEISHQSLLGVDLLPDVLRQLGAMVRLLTEFATDPRFSKVEVLELRKQSPLTARLRVVTVRDRPNAVKGSHKRPVVRGTVQPLRRLERAYTSALSARRHRTVDASGLSALKEFAQLLKNDVATITTANETMVIDSQIIRKIDSRLGVIQRSRGTVSGILEGLNVHSKPWQFTVYPEIGPPKVRCTFDEELFESVRAALRQVVTVHGLKDYVADSPWPLRMEADSVVVSMPAEAGAWLDLVENFEALWQDSDADERDLDWEYVG